MKYVPQVIEPSAGVDRLLLALICNAYHEEAVTDEKGSRETRVVLKFHPRIAPIKVAVFPLLKNRPELVAKALEVRERLRPQMAVFYDEAGAIGRRYRRQDEAGTPFGVTIDFDTLGEQGPELKDTVTLRDRDSMKQQRVKIGELGPMLIEKIRSVHTAGNGHRYRADQETGADALCDHRDKDPHRPPVRHRH